MASCARCKRSVQDRFLFALSDDQRYHISCLYCDVCLASLQDEEKCYWKNGHLLCGRDYDMLTARLCGVRCAACRAQCHANCEINVINDVVFHKSCVRCEICHSQLATGDVCQITCDSQFLCKDHIPKRDERLTDLAPKCALAEQDESETREEKTALGGDWCSFSTTSVDGPEDVSFSSCGTTDREDSFLCACAERNEGCLPKKSERTRRRPKRKRTAFSLQQLALLWQAYSENCRPSSEERERLASSIGLPARVVRVWFQNRRCAAKRSSEKQTTVTEDQPEEMCFYGDHGNCPLPGRAADSGGMTKTLGKTSVVPSRANMRDRFDLFEDETVTSALAPLPAKTAAHFFDNLPSCRPVCSQDYSFSYTFLTEMTTTVA